MPFSPPVKGLIKYLQPLIFFYILSCCNHKSTSLLFYHQTNMNSLFVKIREKLFMDSFLQIIWKYVLPFSQKLLNKSFQCKKIGPLCKSRKQKSVDAFCHSWQVKKKAFFSYGTKEITMFCPHTKCYICQKKVSKYWMFSFCIKLQKISQS